MKEIVYNKLVRDNTPEIILGSGKIPTYKCASDDGTFSLYLGAKLIEETEELLAAKTREQRLEELADVCEVVFALTGFNVEDLTTAILNKRTQKGGYEKRIVLFSVVDICEEESE